MNHENTRPPGARALALRVLSEWEETDAFAEALMEKATRTHRVSPADRGFLNALVLGVIRNRSLLDHWIDGFRDGKLKPEARHLLRIGLFQILILHVPDHAAVNETVDLAGPARGLVNAVLRRALRERDALLANLPALPTALRYSHPSFLIDRWTHARGAERAREIAAWNNEPAPVIIRANRLHPGAAETLDASSDAVPVSGHPGFFNVDSVPHAWLSEGLCYVQDPATWIAPSLLEPKPGQCVLDACAAPGGKAGILAQLMENRGKLAATDASAARCRRLEQNLDRLGVDCARVFAYDWLKAGANPKPWEGELRFDRILLDVPCSNTGVIRRRVDVRWRLSEGFALELREVQLGLVAAVLPLLKPGGRLVYSTCSIEAEENEDLIGNVLERFPQLHWIESRSSVPGHDSIDGAYAALLEYRGEGSRIRRG